MSAYVTVRFQAKRNLTGNAVRLRPDKSGLETQQQHDLGGREVGCLSLRGVEHAEANVLLSTDVQRNCRNQEDVIITVVS